MKKWLFVPAILLSGIAILLAIGVGQWEVVAPRADAELEAQYETHLSPTGTLAIVRRPPPIDSHRGKLKRLPSYNPQQTQNPFQVDLRGYDLSQLDVHKRHADLLHASFDSKTRWPAQLPAGFDWARLMQLGKDPGLGLRQLHAKGITGKGIGIRIIDQTLLVDHTEYRDRLRLYEEIHDHPGPAEMHGPAVASIALGKTVGVAPEADLYYIAETHGVFVVETLVDTLRRAISRAEKLPKTERALPIVLAGGTAKPKGFRELFERTLRARSFPLEVAEVRTASDPLTATARGAHIAAMFEK